MISQLSKITLRLYLKQEKLLITYNGVFFDGVLLVAGFILVYLKGLNLYTCLDLVVIAILLIIARIDLLTFIIPDLLNLAILVLAVLKMILKQNIDLENLLFVLSMGFIIVLLNLLYRKKKGMEAIGYGDLKLLFGYALYMSIVHASISLLIASLSAIVVEIIIRKSRHKLFPFGPYLVLGMIISLFLKFI